ncbi:MAG: arylsulfatase [Sedimentisphaerales bacterium]|nr:arylsulfatase [Sedimentisphaerales bacterium]
MKTRRDFLKAAGISAVGLAWHGSIAASKSSNKPNIIYIMLDELGYFELSCMGHKVLKTPNIDRMAQEGMRFTQCLAGGSVCAPTRCCLLTGKHTGHSQVRRNSGGNAITEDEITLGEMMKSVGYATGGFGKWGIGDAGTTGAPERHGFDVFYGYYHQVHAHSYYPRYLIRNGKKEYLDGNTGDYEEGKQFSHYLIYEEAVKFIKANKSRPFFCYLPWTPPHGYWGFPKDDPSWALYKDTNLRGKAQRKETDARVYAAMVNMVDRQVGEIFKLLKDLRIDDNTIVFFCGDNGGAPYFKDKKNPRGVFDPNGGVFQGGKGNLYEGGLRVPFIVRWPGRVKPDCVSNHLCYFPDIMPTLANITDANVPDECDGISMLPTLLGEATAGCPQNQHKYLYWEYKNQIAVRMKNWKALKLKKRAKWMLFDLTSDPGEKNNLADKHPEIINKIIAYAKEAHSKPFQGHVLDPSKGFKGHKKD